VNLPGKWRHSSLSKAPGARKNIIEVVSRDDPQRDLVTKRNEYAQAGIPEYWIVNPQTETVTVLRLDDARYVEHGVFGRGEVATSAHYAGLQAPVGDVLDAP